MFDETKFSYVSPAYADNSCDFSRLYKFGENYLGSQIVPTGPRSKKDLIGPSHSSHLHMDGLPFDQVADAPSDSRSLPLDATRATSPGGVGFVNLD